VFWISEECLPNWTVLSFPKSFVAFILPCLHIVSIRKILERLSKKLKKAKYRIGNWREYNEALFSRGSLMILFDEKAIGSWQETQLSPRRGPSRLYSDIAIECALTLGAVFSLPLRTTEGLVRSVIELIRLALPTLDFFTLGGRRRALQVLLPRYQAKGAGRWLSTPQV